MAPLYLLKYIYCISYHMLNVDLGHEHMIYKSGSFIKLNLHKIIMSIYALLEKWPCRIGIIIHVYIGQSFRERERESVCSRHSQKNSSNVMNKYYKIVNDLLVNCTND